MKSVINFYLSGLKMQLWYHNMHNLAQFCPKQGRTKCCLLMSISFEQKSLWSWFWCLWKVIIKDFWKKDDLKIHHEIPIGKFWSKIREIGDNRYFLVGGQNLQFLKSHFFISLYHRCEYCFEIWAKMNINSLFYSTFHF